MNNMIYDCFTFYNEHEIAELRFKELYDVVDYFVVVEGTHTHKGEPKESYFLANQQRFLPYSNKIRHFYLPNLVDLSNAWSQEFKQRENIYHALKVLHVQPDDLIILTDCDEIINPLLVAQLRNSNYSQELGTTIYALVMDLYYYNIETYIGKWTMGYLCLFKSIEASYYDIDTKQNKWHFSKNRGGAHIFIPDAGWHLSYFGDISKIQNKISQFAHQEYNNEKFTDLNHIAQCIKNKTNLFSNDKFTYKPLEENRHNLPKNIDFLIDALYQKNKEANVLP